MWSCFSELPAFVWTGISGRGCAQGSACLPPSLSKAFSSAFNASLPGKCLSPEVVVGSQGGAGCHEKRQFTFTVREHKTNLACDLLKQT